MRAVSIIAALVLSISRLVASPAPSPADAASLLTRSCGLTDIRSEGSPPFHLKATFWIVEPARGRLDGRYEMTWLSPSSWREEIDYPGRHQLAGQNGGSPWIVTESPYQSLRLFDLVNALDVSSHAKVRAGSAIESVKDVVLSHRAAQRIRLREQSRFPWAEIVVDSESGALLRHESGPAQYSTQHFRTILEFSDYTSWHDRRFPRLIRRRDGSKSVLEVRVVGIDDVARPESAAITRPENAEDRPLCSDEERAAKISCDISRADQSQPPADRPSGTTSARAVLARDGRVHDIVIVDSLGFDADGMLMRYLESWRCRPLTCGGVPVDSEIFESTGWEYISH